MECTECKYCNLKKYHSGKWYCSSSNVSIFNLPPDMEKCFKKREKEKRKNALSRTCVRNEEP